MQVDLRLKNWSIKEGTDNNLPSVTGIYVLKCGDIEIATQSFNDIYGEKKIPFSVELMKEIAEVEKKIILEVESLMKW